MKLPLSILLLFFTLTSLSARTPEEGLFEKTASMPKVVQETWDSSFVVIIENKVTLRTGTATLIKIQNLELVTELYFVTANHVVKDLCPTAGICKSGKLAQDMEFDVSKIKVKETSGMSFAEFEVVKVSENPDIAVLKVSVPRNEKLNYPRPIKVATTCNPKKRSNLFAVGFSDVSERISTPGHVIENKNLVHKRWSQGLSLEKEPVLNFGNGVNHLFGTTVDLTGGGSGGALLNENGEIQGIMKGGGPTEYYRGNEIPGKEDYYSLMVECEELTKFFDENFFASCPGF